MGHEYSFNGQREGEKVLTIVKNHPVSLFAPGLKAILLFVLGSAVYILLSGQSSALINKASAIFLLACFVLGVAIFARYLYDATESVFLITNQRVMNVDQQGFFKRVITEAELENIQDVSSRVSGLFKTMFKYGDVVIVTGGAGKGEEIVVKDIPNPYDVQQKIVGSKKQEKIGE